MFSYFFKKSHIKTSSMAIVMAFGITVQGVILNCFGEDFFYGNYGKLLSWITLLLWGYFSFSFFISGFNIKKFKQLHYTNPVNRFGIGTWVAGTSLCGILLYEQLVKWEYVAIIISYLNLFLWFVFIIIALKGFIEIHKTNQFPKVHGILLLTTVSTQSIVILFNTIYHQVPALFDIALISFGICLYLISLFFIIKRYCRHTWTIENDWNNTNCILHGAISITGLACIVSDAVSQTVILFIWFCTVTILLFVEVVEGYRLITRIKLYGVKKAIFTYNVTQWSRVFTFSMFYTFFTLIDTHSIVITTIQHFVKRTCIWIIFSLVFFELIIYFYSVYENRKSVTVKLEEVS
jgi:hypothetical protein